MKNAEESEQLYYDLKFENSQLKKQVEYLKQEIVLLNKFSKCKNTKLLLNAFMKYLKESDNDV